MRKRGVDRSLNVFMCSNRANESEIYDPKHGEEPKSASGKFLLDFRKWLIENEYFSEEKAEKYVAALSYAEEFAISLGLTEPCIIDGDAVKACETVQILKENLNFRRKNILCNGIYFQTFYELNKYFVISDKRTKDANPVQREEENEEVVPAEMREAATYNLADAEVERIEETVQEDDYITVYSDAGEVSCFTETDMPQGGIKDTAKEASDSSDIVSLVLRNDVKHRAKNALDTSIIVSSVLHNDVRYRANKPIHAHIEYPYDSCYSIVSAAFLPDTAHYRDRDFLCDLKRAKDNIQGIALSAKAAPFIMVYRNQHTLNLVVEHINLIKHSTISQMLAQLSKVKLEDIEKHDVLGFVNWLRFDYGKLRDALYEGGSSRDKTVIGCRMKGETLEQVGNRLNITRERVRQIERKCFKMMKRNLDHFLIHDFDPFALIAAQNDVECVSRGNAEELLGTETAALIFWFLQTVGHAGKWQYNKNLDAVIKPAMEFNALNAPIDYDISIVKSQLPDKIEAENVKQRLIETIPEISKLPKGVIEIMIAKEYRKFGNILSRSKFTIEEQCKYVLEKYFADGITYTDEQQTAKFAEYLKTLFGTNLKNRVRDLGHSLSTHLARVGVLSAPSSFIPATDFENNAELKDLILSLDEYVSENRYSAVLYNEIFQAYKERLSQYGVHNCHLMHGLMRYYGSKYYCRRDYVTKDANSSFMNEFEKYVLERGAVHKDELLREFPGLRQYSIGIILNQSPQFISLGGGYIIHKNSIDSLESNGESSAIIALPAGNKQIEQILLENFPNGFNLNINLDLRKFKHCFEEKFEEQYCWEDNTLRKEIAKLCVVDENRARVVSSLITLPFAEDIVAYIQEQFENGEEFVYYDAVFDRYKERFFNEGLKTDSGTMLKKVLQAVAGKHFNYFADYAAYKTDYSARHKAWNKIADCMRMTAIPMTADELYEKLPNISIDEIKSNLKRKEFIYNGAGQYLYCDTYNITEQEKVAVENIIEKLLSIKNCISMDELLFAIEANCPNIIADNNIFSPLGQRNMLKRQFGGKYAFSGNIISKSSVCASAADQFANFCKENLPFNIDTLRKFADSLQCAIFYETVYEYALRVSRKEFVSKQEAQFDIEATDKAIEIYMLDRQFMPFAEIQLFAAFPYAGFVWNEFLLEQFVYAYSQKFKLIHATDFTQNTVTGAIVRKDSDINSFDELASFALADSKVALNAQDALQYLKDNGYIFRQAYSHIDAVLIKARELRNKRKSN